MLCLLSVCQASHPLGLCGLDAPPGAAPPAVESFLKLLDE